MVTCMGTLLLFLNGTGHDVYLCVHHVKTKNKLSGSNPFSFVFV